MFEKTAILLSLLLVLMPSIVSAQSSGIDLLIRRMESLGAFDIMVFVLFMAIIFAILRKSKILGESVAINGLIAIIVSFLIFIFPTFTGFSLVLPMSRFFTQASVIILLFVIGLVVASVFYPNMMGMLADQFKTPAILWIIIPIILVLLITSRTIWVFWAGYGVGPTSDTLVLVAAILIFAVVLLIASAIGMGGKK